MAEQTPTNESITIVKVGFNQQQRELIERVKASGALGTSDAEVIRSGFVKWLTTEGSLPG